VGMAAVNFIATAILGGGGILIWVNYGPVKCPVGRLQCKDSEKVTALGAPPSVDTVAEAYLYAFLFAAGVWLLGFVFFTFIEPKL
jgi:hypothetical protein